MLPAGGVVGDDGNSIPPGGDLSLSGDLRGGCAIGLGALSCRGAEDQPDGDAQAESRNGGEGVEGFLFTQARNAGAPRTAGLSGLIDGGSGVDTVDLRAVTGASLRFNAQGPFITVGVEQLSLDLQTPDDQVIPAILIDDVAPGHFNPEPDYWLH